MGKAIKIRSLADCFASIRSVGRDAAVKGIRCEIYADQITNGFGMIARLGEQIFDVRFRI